MAFIFSPKISMDFSTILEEYNALLDEDELQELTQLLKKVEKIAAPKALYSYCTVKYLEENQLLIGDIPFESDFVKSKLSDGMQVIPYICTCGTELEDLFQQIEDPLYEYIADTIKKEYLYKLMTAFKTKMQEQLSVKTFLNSLNPGSLKQWDIFNQKKLFAIFGEDYVKEKIGVTLTDSMLMLPTKTGSGIFYVSEKHFESCSLCPNLDCPNRRAPYQENTTSLT